MTDSQLSSLIDAINQLKNLIDGRFDVNFFSMLLAGLMLIMFWIGFNAGAKSFKDGGV